jgi:hypothetical protein
MDKILYDKINGRKSDVSFFVDQKGYYWVDTDPKGRQMSGRVTIECIGDGKNQPQFEIKDK